MRVKGRRQSTNIEDRRGQTFGAGATKTFDGKLPRYNRTDAKLDDKIFEANASDSSLLDKVEAKVAEGVIKVRQKLGYRNYANGGPVTGTRTYKKKGC